MDNTIKKYKIGYTQGVFDMFHIGHLNLINRAKEQCEYLIVGVNSDELVQTYKNKKPVINEKCRAEIVRNLKAVDKCIIVETLDKLAIYNQIHFDAIFIGNDWYGNPRWMDTKNELAKFGIDVIFLPHTEGVSSTLLRPKRENQIEE